MQVVALEKGFYGGVLRRVGAIFNLDEKFIKKGKLPSWVKAAPNAAVAKEEATKAKKAAEDKVKAGAIAASGGQAAKDKAKNLAEEMAGAGDGNLAG